MMTWVVPWGQRDLLSFAAEFHGAMLGFALTVFGFTILGGKDDFFEPVMQSRGKSGLSALRDMVLLLWWPILLHALALGLCCMRMTSQPFWVTNHKAAIAWRLAYVFAAAWSVLQSYFSMRYLFILAVTRLNWRFKELKAKTRETEGAKEEQKNK